MLSRYTEKNNYGGYTDHIKINSLFNIFIHGTDNNSYVVEFKEWRWINYKTRFSFVSNDNLESTIIEAFDRVFIFFQKHKDYIWTPQQKNSKLNQVLKLLRRREK